jgi:hypothetical protein
VAIGPKACFEDEDQRHENRLLSRSDPSSVWWSTFLTYDERPCATESKYTSQCDRWFRGVSTCADPSICTRNLHNFVELIHVPCVARARIPGIALISNSSWEHKAQCRLTRTPIELLLPVFFDAFICLLPLRFRLLRSYIDHVTDFKVSGSRKREPGAVTERASPGWSCLSDNLLCLPDEPIRKRVYSLVCSRYESISIEMWKRSNRLPPAYVVVDLSLVKYSQCVDIGSSSPRSSGQCKTVANELRSEAVTSCGMVGSIGAYVIGFRQLYKAGIYDAT